MGSRLKQNPERNFIWFFEALCPVTRDKDPGVLFQFPNDFKDEDSSQTLPRFCFPYDIKRVGDGVAVQNFTFVLTDLEGCQRFGFCRLTNSTHTCLCILSYLPWFEVFYKLLNSLADYLSKGQTNEMKALLALIYEQPVPLTVGSIALQIVPFFVAPDPRSLPSIPENRNLTELIVAVNVGNLLQVYASMLFERRILLCARKLSTLTACMHALSALLYPMYWQHIFIPVLPPHLLDYCCAPMPYLIGVHSSLFEGLRSSGLEDVVILDVDSNTVESPFDDLKRIPANVVAELKAHLKRRAMSTGCGVSQAFLRAQALLFGGYRNALQKNQDGEMCFSEELFLNHKSARVKPFLQSAIHLQFFKQFIDSRLELLNKGRDLDDLFEELIIQDNTTGRGKSCQQLVGNLKKGGGSLIHNMKTKANAKWLTTSSVKNLLVHKRHHNDPALQRGGSVSHHYGQSDCLQSRLPITQHFGKSRPQRPAQKKRHEDKKDSGDKWDRGVPGLKAELDLGPHEKEEEQEVLLCDLEELDLLGEIFDTLGSHEPCQLYGTRSLDLFGPDSHDFITKRPPDSPSQQSLSMSINGSLYSWNLDSTEDSEPEPDFSLQVEGADTEENTGIKNIFNSEEEEEEEEEEVEGGVNVTDLEKDPGDEADRLWGGEDSSEREEQEEEAIKQTDNKEEEKQEDVREEEESKEMEKEGGMCVSPQPPAPTEEQQDQSAAAQEEELTSSRPKVMSAVARFQSQPSTRPNFQLRPTSKTLSEAAAQSSKTQHQPPEEDSCASLSVSELKKRFEV